MGGTDSESSVVVYTAIFGNYDVLIEPDKIEDGVDYVCFTDNDQIDSSVWDLRVKNPKENPVLNNRRIKILAHEYLDEYDVSVYIDGNIQIKDDILPLINDYLDDVDFAVYTHTVRNSLSEEADACIAQDKASEEDINQQINYYRQQDFPDEEGLSENRILFRRHNSVKVKAVMEAWWKEVSVRTSRDQLSLMYVLWQHDVDYKIIPHPVKEAPQFEKHPHRPEGYPGRIWPYWMRIRTARNSNPWNKALYYSVRGVYVLTNEGVSTLISEFVSKVRRAIGRDR